MSISDELGPQNSLRVIMCNEQNRDEQNREKEQMERLEKRRDKQSINERKD